MSMNLGECIAAVCRAAQRKRKSGRPPITLFWFTGHRKYRNKIVETLLVEELRKNPELVREWWLYSADKRYSPAWYYYEKQEGSWAVGYYHNDPCKRTERIYNDEVVACANFILREMGKPPAQ